MLFVKLAYAISLLLLETQLRQPHQSKPPRAHPHLKDITQVPAVDLSPEVKRGRMLFARYLNINSNSFKKIHSTKKATTEQTF